MPDRQEYSEADLEFVVGEAAPDAADKERLKALLREDKDFRTAMVGDERVFQRVMNDEGVAVRVSPALYFEVLLRRALTELEVATHTVELAGRQTIPVFDTGEVVELLGRAEVLDYLAKMLASFTRIHSYVSSVRVRRGVRRRVRYNDMDIDSLVRLCVAADEEHRFGYYKRIADVCLFVSGIFRGYATSGSSDGASGQRGASWAGQTRRSLEDYETEGRRFYGLAEKHPTARALDLSEVFGLLRRHFSSARKPLSFIAAQYLHSRGRHLFGEQARAGSL